MAVHVREAEIRLHNIPSRLPFHYGIAVLREVPHLVLTLQVDVDGRPATGMSADNLMPKWFTKNPQERYNAELQQFFTVIDQACRTGIRLGQQPSVFRLWWELHSAQSRWARRTSCPALLAGFGVSLVERALIDAFCRATGTPFHQALHHNTLGLQLDRIHPQLAGHLPAQSLPRVPSSRLTIRHTVGLADPLTDGEVTEPPADDLPCSLTKWIRRCGLTHFKIKLSGTTQQDLSRLQNLATVLLAEVGSHLVLTLDGNEQFASVATFHAFWETARQDPQLAELLNFVIYVEQPLPRSIALAEATADELLAWLDRPALIIDESDSGLHSMLQALDAGYCGTSHKNCKGVFKSIANVCLLNVLRQEEPGRNLLLSAEDLTTVGPLALQQDLAVIAALGLDHAERNGQHYFAGLQPFPAAWQQLTADNHPDLYRLGASGFPSLSISRGRIQLDSVNQAPFGVAGQPELSDFAPRSAWQPPRAH